MPKTNILNDIVELINEVYEFAPTFWNWAIVLTSIYILLKK